MPEEMDHYALSRQTILAALTGLNDKLAAEGVIGELCIFGGAAMVLAFNARLSTKDVDAIFKPPGIIRRLAAEVADSMGLPVNWINDGVKGFVSGAPEHTSEGLTQWSHLRMVRPNAEYLLAMKCMASRAAGYDTQGDRDDIAFLICRTGLRTAEEVLSVVEKFYPPERILPKTHFMLLEVFENLAKGNARPALPISDLSAESSCAGAGDGE